MRNYIATAILLGTSLGILWAEQVNILFIGNSFTFRHELPLLVKDVIEEGQPGLTVNAERITYGGQDMFRHHDLYFSETLVRLNTVTVAEVEEKIDIIQSYLEAGEAPGFYNAYWEKTGLKPVDWAIVEKNMQRALKHQQSLIDRIKSNDRIKWDYLVLQSWKDVVDDVDAGYGEYVQKWAQLAQQEGIKVILYITAPHAQNAYPVTEPVGLAQTEMELSTIGQLKRIIQPYAVVPVALGLKKIQQNGTDLVFRYINDMHPNQFSAFLTANMFYAALFKESTEGFNFDTVVETKLDSEGKNPDGGNPEVVFDEATKTILQRTAYESVMAFNAEYGFASEADYLVKRPPWAGVWVNTFGKAYDFSDYQDFLGGEAGRLKWADLQTGPESFDFGQIREALERVDAAGYSWYGVLWTGPDSGPWIYDNGVPRVFNTDGVLYPYYLDEDYRAHLAAFFKALTAYLASLPENLLERIAFLQPGFGSTGDRQLFKGILQDDQYAIDSAAYVDFMKETTRAWYTAFRSHPALANIRFLWNIDDYDGLDPSELNGVNDRARGEMRYGAWMKANYNCQLRKQQFTIAIGYMAVGEQIQDKEQRPLFFGTTEPPRWGGNPEFVRGEHNDPKWAATPMAQKAPKWHYYWTAISSVDRGLDGWETRPDFLLSGEFSEAFKFSHRYSFLKRPKTSPWAFVALRDVLDYSDAIRFPESEYGFPNKDNLSRINSILAEYAPYGAANEDSSAVMNRSRADYLLKSKGLNDCVWQVIDRNYRRHMFQIDPHETSIGWWRVGSTDQPYGRFARGFEHSSGRDTLYFKFVEKFITNPPQLIEVKVVYFDETAGSTWELRYDNGGESLATAFGVTCVGDGLWKTRTITLTDAVFAGRGPRGADLTIVNTDSIDDKFHLVEVRRRHDYEAFSMSHGLIEGRGGDDDGDSVSNFEEFALGGDPRDPLDSGLFSHMGFDDDGLVYTCYRRSSLLSGVAYDVQLSRDLENWSSADQIELSCLNMNATMDVLQLPISLEEKASIFSGSNSGT